ncbi:MAG: UDP-2-acetamido-2-deoxy-ribo-hexuluronate aminotransferase [Rikenellaceae bacterium]|nr:UDP-2-acetamido-2-deoxy-ribo-hexuluronate aminotransferase [Rikenellaceae bacterium]
MKPIKMVDLQTQYQNIKTQIDSAIQQVIDSTAFINGPVVNEFKQDLEKYLNVKHVIPCANGTDALQIALMSLDLKPGDEVITPTFTFISTVEVVALLGLKPVFADVNPDTFNINVDDIKKLITKNTKAIIPVHLFGQCADMEEIMSIAKENNIYVIEDNAQAIGADFFFSNGKISKSGTIGDIGCTSFFPSKNLGCYGDGGALFTNSDALAEKLSYIVNHGMKKRYYHDYIGVNSRLDTLQAAILKVKLQYLDNYIAARQKAAAYYDKAFASEPKLKIPMRFAKSSHVFHQYTLQAVDFSRNELLNFLKEKQIPAMIYYPIPIHLQKAYQHYVKAGDNYPISEHLSKFVFSLPMHTELDEEQLEYITNSVLEFINK